jgi:hypothetical protein
MRKDMVVEPKKSKKDDLTNSKILAMAQMKIIKGYKAVKIDRIESVLIAYNKCTGSNHKYPGSNNAQIMAVRDLGLTKGQVQVANFGNHTMHAIKADMARGATLQAAYYRYVGLNNIQVEAVSDLGLTRNQVQVYELNFGVINSIKSDMAQGVSLEDAYTKYVGLSYAQCDAIRELGLTRDQVKIANFSYETVYAMENLMRRGKDLAAAYEMVKGKSHDALKQTVLKFLLDNRKQTVPLAAMTTIRVVVSPGRGNGHQRAALTLMLRLRELGFNGAFDVVCKDHLGGNQYDPATDSYFTVNTPDISERVRNMLPNYNTAPEDSAGFKNIPEFGSIRITSLPHDYSTIMQFIKVDLVVRAAADTELDYRADATVFNGTSFISLQPTDWYQGRSYVVDQDGVIFELASAKQSRLATKNSTCTATADIKLTAVEERILTYLQTNNFNTQLVYGLYPSSKYNIETRKMETSGNLDEALEVRRIVEANQHLSKITGKPTLLLLPQEVAQDPQFKSSIRSSCDATHFVDFTNHNCLFNVSSYDPESVIIAYTGALQQQFFDYLMLQGTTLPPVIEGCNSREICENAGKPFIHGSGINDPLRKYAVGLKFQQELHSKASKCLETGQIEFLPALIEYMLQVLQREDGLLDYHLQRLQQYHEQPDATNAALEMLGTVFAEATAIHESTVKPAKKLCRP